MHGGNRREREWEHLQFRRSDLDTLLAVRHSIGLGDKVRFFLCRHERKRDAALPVLAMQAVESPVLEEDNSRGCAQNQRRRYGGERSKVVPIRVRVGLKRALLGGGGFGL